MKLIIKPWIYSVVASAVGLLITPFAYALQVPPPGGAGGIETLPKSPLQNTTDLTNLICGFLPWIFWGLIVLAIVMALIAAYKYVTAAGDPEKVSNASKTLLYAAIAVAVALIAEGVPYLVSSFIGNSNFISGGICSGK